jgi:ABC-type Mn2+/Zn2+ transport system ATPase subunit
MTDPHEGICLDISGLTVAYDGLPALTDVSLRVAHGARVAVVGPNGAGKSTLFKTLVGLLPVKAGRVSIAGRPPGDHDDPVAYVPQREEIDWLFPVTVRDVVMMGRYGRLGWLRRPRPVDREVVARSLGQLDLTDLAEQPIAELSGGQQQRVFLARALAQEPHVLLLDEPFTGVDVSVKEGILEVLDTLRPQSVTVLVSTHDMELAATRFDLVLLLKHHVIAFGPAAEVFVPEHISQAFGGQAMALNGMMVIDQCCPGPDAEN